MSSDTPIFPTGSPELYLADRHAKCTTLGPGVRFALWVQGCPLRCDGCVAPETLPFEGGTRVAPADLAEEILACDGIDGLTFSGGEPFAQAAGLVELVDRVHEHRPTLTIVSYTGFTLEYLQRRGDPVQRSLLDRLDLLIDGPYIATRHAPVRWRGSANQKLHALSGRIRVPADDVPAGIQVVVDENGLRWIGVPPEPGFRRRFESALAGQGILLSTDDAEEGT